MSDLITAIVQTEQSTLQLTKIPKPKPGPKELLVKVSHAAQNPTDVFALDGNRFGPGAVLGCDFVGTVEEVGEDAGAEGNDGREKYHVGDTVAGLVRGGSTKNLGAFAEYSLAQKNVCFKVPPGMDLAKAATIPLAAATAWLAMFSRQCLRMERGGVKEGKQSLLVWGGSSSVGLHTLQLARLCSISIITTCSPRNFDLVRSYGADNVLDYSDPDVVSKIRVIEPNLQYVFDSIGNKNSSVLAAGGLEGKGKLCTVRPGKMYTEDVKEGVQVSDVMVWTGLGMEVRYGESIWPVNQEDQDLVAELFGMIPGWVEQGVFKGNKARVLEGLGSVEKGFQMFRDGEVSGFKIVYKL